MKILGTVADIRTELAGPRRQGHSIGLVPTMGAFHDGHLSLIRRARRDCDLVVVSLFVNPTQFNDASDLQVYPREEERDAALAAQLNVDYLFAPGVAEVYPSGFATSVSVRGVTDGLEGLHRGRAHFDGVTTVVTKLLNMVSPDVAYFGQKDAQQAAVVRRLVRDLNVPVRVEVCPTMRAPDGLALSSRNALLSPSQRDRATALHRALAAVRDAVRAGERDPDAATEAGRAELAAAGIEPEYLKVVSPETMEPVERIEGDALAVIAARIGSVRLIDNVLVGTTVEQPAEPADQAEVSRMSHTIRNTDHEVATPFGAPTI